MEIIDKIITTGALALFSLPFLVIIGGAAYMVYSPKINSYNVITECDTCRHRGTPYCAACWRCKWNPLYWVHKQLIYNGPSRRLRHWLGRNWRNDMQPQVTTCRSCGAPIVWKKTASGKSMPCEAYPITIVPNPKSKFKALDKYGKLIPCDKVSEPSELSETAWEPHWGNCSAPDKFRRR